MSGIAGTVEFNEAETDIKNMVVRCTICLHQLNHHDHKELRKHRLLDVLVCKECSDFYDSREFLQDESGNYNYCTWCGCGGKRFLCELCPNVFCSTCVYQNFGNQEVSLVSKEGWKCYRCNPQKLEAKVTFCNLILEYSAKLKQKNDKKNAVESIFKSKAEHSKHTETQDWVSAVFDQLDEFCKTFHQRLENLKDISISQSKGLKHVIKKMEEIIAFHKTKLGQILKFLCDQYNKYIHKEGMLKKITVSENKTNEETNRPIRIQVSSNPEVINIVSNSESAEGITQLSRYEKSAVEVDEKSSVKANENATSHDANPSDNNDDSNYQAKISLLKVSSDSNDSDPGECPSNLENKSNSKNETNFQMSLTGDIRDVVEIKSDSSFDEINEALNDASFDDSSDKEVVEKDPGSDHNVQMFKEESTSKIRSKTTNKKVCKELATVFDSDSSDLEILFDSEVTKSKRKKSCWSKKTKLVDVKDPKLKLQTYVMLDKCDYLLPGTETTIPLPANYKLAQLRQKLRNCVKYKKKLLKKKVIKKIKPQTTTRKKKVIVEKPSKKEKSKSTKAQSDSSEDFPPRMKKKYGKLLHKRISSDESGNENSRSEMEEKISVDDHSKQDSVSEHKSTNDSDSGMKQRLKKRRIKKRALSSSDSEGKEKGVDGEDCLI